MTAREQLVADVIQLNDKDFQRVERFIRHLKSNQQLDESSLKKLYVEASNDDRMLVQEGMAEYLKGLKSEDEK